MMPALRLAVAVLAATTTLAFQACPATAPAAPRLDSALRAKYVDANGARRRQDFPRLLPLPSPRASSRPPPPPRRAAATRAPPQASPSRRR